MSEYEDIQGEQFCAISMGDDGSICGRPIHMVRSGVDETATCLMHSNDPDKQSGSLYEAFMREFESILEQAGDADAHFECFVFPEVHLDGRTMLPNCEFRDAVFTQEVGFGDVTFARAAEFYGAVFRQDADFRHATFTQNASFTSAKFEQEAEFGGAKFAQDAQFNYGTTFTLDATFASADFTGQVSFLQATFSQDGDFSSANFAMFADFFEAVFARNADFSRATFTNDADFGEATFAQEADFSFATFAKGADFTDAEFNGSAGWIGASFLGKAEFRGTRFATRTNDYAAGMFWRATFSNPGDVVFEKTDLSCVSFHNCDVTGIRFTSSVRWGKKDKREAVIYDELIVQRGKSLAWRGYRGKEEPSTSHREVAQIYQQLKRNYDTQLDYWTANEFHFGEMEMKRLDSPTEGRWLTLRRWLHCNLCMIALYRWASDYGNNYLRPMLWLLGVLLLFAALFPWPGIVSKQRQIESVETYTSAWHAGNSLKQAMRSELGLVGKGLLTALDTATFQRNSDYVPVYPWGRTLAIAETLLTSILFALFLLAIRRQFRR
jgi:uncharacterized protein YjbI with pentapeptide repeats